MWVLILPFLRLAFPIVAGVLGAGVGIFAGLAFTVFVRDRKGAGA